MKITRFLIASWIACVASATSTLAAPRYTIRVLESVDGQVDVYAKGVNNSGQVVGYTVDFDGNSHAMLWDESGAHPLVSLSTEMPFSEAYRINDAGRIAGKAAVESGNFHAALWDTDRSITDIGTLPGGIFSFAHDVNDAGVVVGSSGAEIGQSAFTWTASGGLVDYGNADPPFRLATAGFNGVNNHGLYVGTFFFFGTPFHAAIAREGDGRVTDISPPGRESLGMAMAVNDAGTIVGYQNNASGAVEAAIFHEEGGYTNLGLLGLDETLALDVNESGVIVGRGYGFLPGELVQKSFVYEDGQMRDLLTLVPPDSGWEQLFEAAAVNDVGVIAGAGVYRGEIRAFVATPVPEPLGIATIFACGIAYFSWLHLTQARSAWINKFGKRKTEGLR